MRKAGILLPIFSLPSDYGIGTLGLDAYKFVDFLKKSGQTYWQVLPIGPTSYGDSPYQSFSCFAGNPYFIDLDLLNQDGLLENSEYEYLKSYALKIDYEKLYQTRFNILKKAYERFDQSQMLDFINQNEYWLDDYACFMTLKFMHNGQDFYSWEDEYKFHQEDAIKKFKAEHDYEIKFWYFIQYEFDLQWMQLKHYANKSGIKIIGDMPIYSALDSSDVWSKPEEFLLDKELRPYLVAGVPPDAFSKDGQLWGNPLYNYDHMKKTGYQWWIQRVKKASQLFDTIRIDHFRGFEAFYAIPYGDKDAKRGKWMKGPNYHLFDAIKKEVGELDIIAENLGFLTPSVQKMLDKLQYPGMKVLEFGFAPDGTSDAVPHKLEPHMVVYTGTHDNAPVRGWYEDLDSLTKEYFNNYLHIQSEYEVVNSMIRCALGSVCNLAVIPLVDYLQKGNESRINTPSTLGNNWVWRMEKNDMNDDLSSYINGLMKIYCRK